MDPWAVLFRRYLQVAAAIATVAMSYFAAAHAQAALQLATAGTPATLLLASLRCLAVAVVLAYLASIWHRRADKPHAERRVDGWLAAGTSGVIFGSAILGMPAALALLVAWVVLQAYYRTRLHDAGLDHLGHLALAAEIPVPRGIMPPRKNGPRPRPLQPSPCSFCGSRKVDALVVMADGAICRACAWSNWVHSTKATHCTLCSTPLATDVISRVTRDRKSAGLRGARGVACVDCTTTVRGHFAELPPLDDDTIATLEIWQPTVLQFRPRDSA